MTHIFVSYAAADSAIARTLARTLEEDRDTSVFYYEHRGSRGQSFVDLIESEIQRSDLFVIVLSPDYLASYWCRRERNLALALEADLGNDDQATRKQLDVVRVARLDRRTALHWNAVPWPVPQNQWDRNVAPAASALLGILPELRGVIALGAYARRVWTAAGELDPNVAGLAYLHSTHPERSSTIDLRRVYRYAAEIAAD